MRKSLKIGFVFSSILFISFIVFTVLLTKINVDTIGPNNSKVGFALINEVMFKLFGKSNLFDKLSDVILLISFLAPIGFVVLGIYQLIKRKSFKKVDSELYVLAITYILTLIIFIIFEFITINYRPVLIEGKLERSYPSTHVLLSFTFLFTAIITLKNYIKRIRLRKIVNSFLLLIIIASITFRILSGMHWFTDIIGATILATAITTLYHSFVLVIRSKREIKKN